MKNLIERLSFVITVFALILSVNIVSVKATTYNYVSHVVYDTNLNAHTVTDDDLVCIVTDTETGVTYIFKSISYGTTMYYDLDGKIQKVKNSSTGDILKDFTKENTTTKTTEKVTTKTVIWNTKVKKLKKTTVKKSYKAYESPTAKKPSKIKYVYGYKFTWKKVKGAKGYVVQRYAPAEKKWVTIKTIKGNTKSKRKYTMTNLMKCKVKVRVKAYKTINRNTAYSKASKTISFTCKTCTKLDADGWQIKTYADKFASEYAFVKQNEIRKKAGVNELKWSTVLYEIGIYRLTTSGYDFHKNASSDVENYFKKNGASLPKSPLGKTYSVSNIEGVGYTENLALGQESISSVISAWKNSPGHYANMISDDANSGAISFLNLYNEDAEYAGMLWIGTFSSQNNFDLFWNT
jgi:uncharacterized protein YkwD